MRCKARHACTGTQCSKPAAPGRAVCAGHGGLSTGPNTAEGKARIAAAKTVHGRETRALRLERSRISAELHRIEQEMRAAGLYDGPRLRGRKPSRYRTVLAATAK
jgi:hypothetical protein